MAAGLLLNLTPGPDVLDIVAKGLRGGARVVAVQGSTAGGFVHIAAAAIGVSALIAASSAALTVLKWLGAAYLVYIGVSMLWSESRQKNAIKIEAYYSYCTRAIGLNDSNNCSKNDLAQRAESGATGVQYFMRVSRRIWSP